MRSRDSALAVLVALIWGTNFVAIRTGLDSMPPMLFLAVRFVVVCVPAVFLVRRPALPWRDLALIGLFTSLGQFALMYLALHLGMPPGLSSLVLQAQVLLTVVIAALWLRERPSVPQRLGVAVGGAGLVTIAVGRGLSAPVLPLVVLVLAAVSWAVGNVLTRRAGALTGPGAGLGVTVWSGLVVPLPALVLSLAIEGPDAVGTALTHLQWSAVLSTAYTAYLSSLLGYGIWNTLLSRHPVARVTPFAMLVPVFGMAAAAVAFGERPTVLEAAGGAVLLAGVGVAVLRPRRSADVAVDVEPATGPAAEPADLVQLAGARPPAG
ncbi:O-acetylserine/cysteine efflux transporter [Humibacillus xanthopallidus]|uniref:O-acetylserine/cysteine efflux transporter n=1 Tax=Humibacillus xanthopallidus TaxID=412689 RepID=A0A543PVY0_9MICO|nr:EamA family transporter [Humibacillus xanthopallidus]TQN48215.1 O-acetylserine/cysteine efflux transporter [Humibacillus xanthopallidus]